MNFNSKQYTINYQYYSRGREYPYDDFYSLRIKKQDKYVVNGYSMCDAINKLLDHCRAANQSDVYLLSCEEK